MSSSSTPILGALLLSLSCADSSPKDIDPSGRAPGSPRADAAPQIDAAFLDAASPDTACERLCTLLVICEEFQEWEACLEACTEQIATCSPQEVAEVVRCSPERYFQCAAVQGCVGDISCFETNESTGK